MPLISPLAAAQLRRSWQLVLAVLVFVAFMLGHLLVFQPSSKRYRAMVRRAGNLGFATASGQPQITMPPRVLALVADNSLPEPVAQARGTSGELAAELMSDLTRMAARHRIEILLADPGQTTQLPAGVQVRAHLRLQCSYPEAVAFLGDLAAMGKLISIDRFELTGGDSAGQHLFEVWLTRHFVKQSPRKAS